MAGESYGVRTVLLAGMERAVVGYREAPGVARVFVVGLVVERLWE